MDASERFIKTPQLLRGRSSAVDDASLPSARPGLAPNTGTPSNLALVLLKAVISRACLAASIQS